MDSKTLTHIGGELVVLAGVSFYFQKRCNKLEQQNKELAEALNVLNQEFDSMYRAVKAIQDRLGNHSSHSTQHHSHNSQRPSSNSSNSSVSSVPKSNSKSLTPETKEPKETKESLEDDPELLKELERIRNERKNLETETEDEECKDGVCLINTNEVK